MPWSMPSKLVNAQRTMVNWVIWVSLRVLSGPTRHGDSHEYHPEQLAPIELQKAGLVGVEELLMASLNLVDVGARLI